MPAIRHDSESRRFATEVGGVTAFISYRERAHRVLDLDHTFVPQVARGGGIASQLTAHALAYARANDYRVVPSCPFVAAFIRRHPEFRDLVA